MSQYFTYKSSNGILRYLYDKDKTRYFKQFKLEESNHSGDADKTKAFDFVGNSYWVCDGAFTGKCSISICFNNIFVMLESFEITTSEYGCRPGNFGVEYSIDGEKYIGYKEFSNTMAKRETKKFSYSSQAFRCFKYTVLTSQCAQPRHDIVQYEFFGKIIAYDIYRNTDFIYPYGSALLLSLFIFISF